jgi:hypothetical protein
MSTQRFGPCASFECALNSSRARSGVTGPASACGSRPAATIDGRSMLVSSPVNARVSITSSSRLSTSIAL